MFDHLWGRFPLTSGASCATETRQVNMNSSLSGLGWWKSFAPTQIPESHFQSAGLPINPGVSKWAVLRDKVHGRIELPRL